MTSGFGVVIALKNIFTHESEEYFDPVCLVAVVATSDAATGKPERWHQRKTVITPVPNDSKCVQICFHLAIYTFTVLSRKTPSRKKLFLRLDSPKSRSFHHPFLQNANKNRQIESRPLAVSLSLFHVFIFSFFFISPTTILSLFSLISLLLLPSFLSLFLSFSSHPSLPTSLHVFLFRLLSLSFFSLRLNLRPKVCFQ